MPYPETEVLNNLVARVFRISDVTLGEPARGLIARYRGALLSSDSAAAYDQLAGDLRPHEITPLFRQEATGQVVYLIPKPPEAKPTPVRTNVILFLLTVLSVLFVGSGMPADLPGTAPSQSLLSGWPYAVSLLAILLAHEFAHYVMSRIHKTRATLPYFIPLPLPPLGTMGAAIIMQQTPKNKRVLFDIGVAGPLAGIVVAIPILFLGLTLSHVTRTPSSFTQVQFEGNSILYLFAKYITFGQLLPAPVSYGDLSTMLYWLRYYFTAWPPPLGGTDVLVGQVAFAGWAGLLVTALNLIPVGTLDGGHVLYGLLGDKARRAYPVILGTLAVLGIVWYGWWLWAALLLWLGRVRAEPLDQITTLDTPRRIIAVVAIVIFILTFSPVPFSALGSRLPFLQ